ncbi:universal stress protein [Actinocatenispora comari]|jgi:nucleotide-binding universal stress UspA family protein|uniref:Universal stress protein n=1 Tax=Actinocatenispora comari TaxID=2807577 RepID=A0A8J4AKK2_9ACTN|nr:universal stress protein [Actinocatenispora comari]GIL30468.1 universal stress protein [Actinocatenispora comari]
MERIPPFVVVGIDGEESSIAALRWAIPEAWAHRARVLAVHAYSEPVVGDATMMPPDTFAHAEEVQRSAQEWRDTALAALPEYPEAEVEVQVRLGPAGPVLTEAACGALLLVVGSHGRHPLHRLVYGSVSHYCVGHAPCPVVAVPFHRARVDAVN